MQYTSYMSRRYFHHATIRDVRRVWAAATAAPRTSVRELATQLDMPHSRASAALRMLRDAGYVAFNRGSARAITIVIPFYVKELK